MDYDRAIEIARLFNQDAVSSPLPPIVHTKSPSINARHKGVWFKPEYDFGEIQAVQDVDGFFSKSIQKKLNRVIIAGFEFVGASSEPVEYIKNRTQEIAYATNMPWEQLIWTTFFDLFRFANCIWVKARDPEISSGEEVEKNNLIIPPIAGYFILSFPNLSFKTKLNGELLKVLETIDGREKQYSPRDIVHFYANRKPGMLVGTPEVLPVLDDLALLRRIEDNVEDLIETNLFPLYHYSVGTDEIPDVRGPDGLTEVDKVRRTLKYMPASGIFVSDHRHKVEAIGSEGKALKIDAYLTYFRSRVLAGLGTSMLDMGEGTGATKSTASTLSKGMLMDIEAMTKIVKSFIEFYVISELLIEGGFNPLDPEEMVYIKFGTIDKDERRADENQLIQLFHGNLRTMSETRKSLGDSPWKEEYLEETFYKMFEEPLALLGNMGPGTAASQTLGEHPSSNVTPEAVKKEQVAAEKMAAKQLAAKGRVSPGASSSARRVSSNKARPANQHGKRSSPKTNRDLTLIDETNTEVVVTCDFDPNLDQINDWKALVYKQWEAFGKKVPLEVIAQATLWRVK